MRIFSLVLLSAILLTGCREQSKRVVGVVPKGANHIFWQTVHAGAIKAALEYDLKLEWNAPTLEIDSSRQIAILDSMVNRHLAGIAVAPVDRKALINVIERAERAGIPVAVFDSAVDTDKILSYVSTDNREGGRMAARELGSLLQGKGKVAVIGFMAGSASTMEREEGFAEELKAKFPGITIVQTVLGMADRAKALAATENILNAHPDLNGIFADCESSSVGAAMALKARANTQVHLVAFDANDQLISDLQDKHVDALILQDPFRMGYESVKAVGMKLNAQAPQPRIDSGVFLVRKQDMEKPDMVTLLRPDVQTWLAREPK